LLCEGAGEAAGFDTFVPAPGNAFTVENMGAGHLLVRRALARERKLPEAAVRFEGPARIRARLARGSDLLHPPTLRKLLTYPLPELRPDIAVVLVDADGEPWRYASLKTETASFPFVPIIAVAVQEFESWMIASVEAVARVVGIALEQPPLSESLARGAAKRIYSDWLARGQDPARARILRCAVAESVDLDAIAKRCRSFERFLQDLRSP
jgi:hypothetical protein